MLFATFALATGRLVPAAEPVEALRAEIERLAAPLGGSVGVAAWRLDGKGPRLAVNANLPFPMASTFKVAVAGAVFARIDDGEVTLDQMVAIDPERYVESEVIADSFIHPGVSLSVHNLLELMLTRSDNTATDILVGLVGGPEAITAWVRSQGVEGLRVDRDTAGIVRDFFELPPGILREVVVEVSARDPGFWARASMPNPEFDDDPRDTSTPVAMGVLLHRIFSGKALQPDSTRELDAMMRRNRTGDARIRARLPEGTTVADKTGTIGGSVNDVGVITLPEDSGQILLTVFIKESASPVAERETVIADIARLVYDAYLIDAPD
jgi:beta-lactamase class A